MMKNFGEGAGFIGCFIGLILILVIFRRTQKFERQKEYM